jgi:hypothetical protein
MLRTIVFQFGVFDLDFRFRPVRLSAQGGSGGIERVAVAGGLPEASWATSRSFRRAKSSCGMELLLTS